MLAFQHLLTAAAAAACLVVGTSASAETSLGSLSVNGVWRNPKDSVHVEIRPCGDAACGYVVWASDKAQADARQGGTSKLIGLQLFRDMKQNGPVWQGKVFVPDLNSTFTGIAQPLDETRLKAKGCLVGAFLCKTQVWRKVTTPVQQVDINRTAPRGAL